jgi:hypothetical protein
MKLSHVVVPIIAVFAFGFVGSMIVYAYTPAGWCGVGMVVTLIIGVNNRAFK